MTLQQMRYFLAACRHGSFTAAAEAMYIAQPSLAEQVRRMEQELGVRLFVRTGRRLMLTEAGTTLQSHAERVVAAMDAAEASVGVTRGLRGGTACLGTFGVAYRYLVQEVVSTFVARHPDVTVRIVGHHSFEVIEKIRNGVLEAGLVSLPVDDPAFFVEPVMSDEVLYAALPGPDTEQPMTIERLVETRFIVYEAFSGWRDSIRRQLQGWAAETGLVLGAAIEVEHAESALQLAARGLGSTYVLRTVADGAAFVEGLTLVPFARPIHDTFAFVWRRDHQLSPATKELLRLTRRHMESFRRPPLVSMVGPQPEPSEAREKRV